MSLSGKTLFITGASRGIGREIALKAAADGANIVIAAKSAEPHPKLEGTIFSVAAEIEAAGGKALALQLDVRDEQAVATAMAQAAEHFGGIDALVNNAGAIKLVGVEKLEPKRFDLMYQINTRAVMVCSQAALPYLKKSAGGHILNLSPPLNLDAKWFAPLLSALRRGTLRAPLTLLAPTVYGLIEWQLTRPASWAFWRPATPLSTRVKTLAAAAATGS